MNNINKNNINKFGLLLLTAISCSFYTPAANAMRPGAKKPVPAKENVKRETSPELSQVQEQELVTYFLSDPSEIENLKKDYADLNALKEKVNKLIEERTELEGKQSEIMDYEAPEYEQLTEDITKKAEEAEKIEPIIEKLEESIIKKLEKEITEKLKALKITPEYVFKYLNTWKGCTPIHLAACNAKSSDFLKILIKIGADINKKREGSEETPLHFACKRSLKNIETLLNAKEINKNAKNLDINAQNKNKSTPLHFLANPKGQSINTQDIKTAFSKLLDKANVTIKNKDGKTILDLIKELDLPGFKNIQIKLESIMQSQSKPKEEEKKEKAIPSFKNGIFFDDSKKVFISGKVSNKFEDSECPICNEKFDLNDQVIQLPCGHILQQDCFIDFLTTWIKGGNYEIIYQNICPLCRHILSNDFIEKYLLYILSKKLEKKQNDEDFTKFKQKLLFYASANGHVNLLKELLKKDMNVNINENIDGQYYTYTDETDNKTYIAQDTNWTPLHFAANSCNLVPKEYIGNTTIINPQRPTIIKILENMPKIIELLIENGADLDAETGRKLKPIDLIANQNSEAFNYLNTISEQIPLLKEIDEKYKDKKRMKEIFFYSIKKGHLKVLEKLVIDKKINVNIKSDSPGFFSIPFGFTPLHTAASSYEEAFYIIDGNPEINLKIMKLLVEKGGAKVTAQNNYKDRPINLIYHKNSDGYKYLADKTEEYLLDFIKKNKNNKNLMKEILFDCARYGYEKVLEALITNKIVDVNKEIDEDDGNTALHYAAMLYSNNPEKGLKIIKMLVEKGKANVTMQNNRGKKYPIYYISNKNSEGAKYLSDKKEEYLLDFIEKNKYDKKLMKEILFNSAKNSYEKVLEALITNKIVDINKEVGEDDGNTALHYATEQYSQYPEEEKCLKTIKLLVEKGKADILIKDAMNYRPINNIKNTSSEGYKYLEQKTENSLLELIAKNKQDKELMKEILKDCASNGYLNVLKKLINEKIIDINTDLIDGYTALHYAVQNSLNPERCFETVKMLVEDGKANIKALGARIYKPINMMRLHQNKPIKVYNYLAKKMGLPEIPEAPEEEIIREEDLPSPIEIIENESF